MAQHRSRKFPWILTPHSCEVLHEVESKEQAEILEAHYIDRLDTSNPDKGWNRRLGSNKYGFADWVIFGFGKRTPASHPGTSNGMYGRKHSEETKEAIRKRAVGRPSALKGLSLSEEMKIRKRVARDGKGYLSGDKSGMYGRKHSEEAKRKISEASKGNTKWLGRKHSEEAKAKMSATKQKRRLERESKSASSAENLGSAVQ